jgi:hypothetical protein
MTTLRWTLGITTTVVAIGWVSLAIGGGGFRRSFGGSDNPAWMVLVPIVAGALIVASLVWPERRVLLHITAAVMIGLVIGCFFLARETMFVATVGILYAALWLSFYYRTVRA